MRHQRVGVGLTSCHPRAQEQHRAVPGWEWDYRDTKAGSLEADNAGVIFPISHLHSCWSLTIPGALPWVVPISLQVPDVWWQKWVAQNKPREAGIFPPAVCLKAALFTFPKDPPLPVESPRHWSQHRLMPRFWGGAISNSSRASWTHLDKSNT